MSDLSTTYRDRFQRILKPLAIKIEEHLKGTVEGLKRIDRVCARAKGIDSFLIKAAAKKDEVPKYSDPIKEIQDQVGARIVTFFSSDVVSVQAEIDKFYRPIESKLICSENHWEFGYVGQHYILMVPSELKLTEDYPEVFELQIKTLFQHAWSEAEHDLGYKPAQGSLDKDAVRELAFTAAQAWGADHIFDGLFRKVHKIRSQSEPE